MKLKLSLILNHINLYEFCLKKKDLLQKICLHPVFTREFHKKEQKIRARNCKTHYFVPNILKSLVDWGKY